MLIMVSFHDVWHVVDKQTRPTHTHIHTHGRQGVCEGREPLVSHVHTKLTCASSYC